MSVSPFSISSMVGDFVVIYRGCVVVFGSIETFVDLIKLDMVYLNFILRIDLIHSCYASLNY